MFLLKTYRWSAMSDMAMLVLRLQCQENCAGGHPTRLDAAHGSLHHVHPLSVDTECQSTNILQPPIKDVHLALPYQYWKEGSRLLTADPQAGGGGWSVPEAIIVKFRVTENLLNSHWQLQEKK